MNLRHLTVLTLSMAAGVFSSASFSQTRYIKTENHITGVPVYTEVFENDFVDIKPEYPGGRNSMIQFINSTREYPHEAYDLGIEGRVTCAFVVNTDGKISHIQVLRGVESSLNREAVRIISKMPEWSPGKINDQPVPVRVVCCIPFRR